MNVTDVFNWLVRKYVQSSDQRQQGMGLQYMTAETHDLAEEIVRKYGWRPIASAPRDGRSILIRFGQDGASQAKYIPGVPYPWQFIDTKDGITWLINHAVDTPGYGPSHWMEMPA